MKEIFINREYGLVGNPSKSEILIYEEKKQSKIERQATREGTEIYYSDDFDEDSSCSEIEEGKLNKYLLMKIYLFS